MQLAYLVNQYPAVSHSFVRREILAVEALGHAVSRFSIRAAPGGLPDPADQEEARRTSVVLSGDVLKLLFAAVGRLTRQPGRVVRAFTRTRMMVTPSRKSMIRRIAYLLEGIWLAGELERAGVEHLHAHFGTNPAAVARVVGIVSGIPYSFTVHGPDEFDEPAHIDLRGKVADAKFVVAISEFGRSQICRWATTDDWRKVVVVRCGLGADLIDRAPVSVSKDIDLCTVARLAPQKGLPVLIEALALLAQRGRKPTLTVIGDGPLRGALEHEVRARHLEGQVRFAGAQDGATVTATLDRSRLMVLPSFAEGLPVVLMEALACGTPVVTTAIAGIPELVDARCGWVVAAGSAPLLADALAEALDASEEHRSTLGAVGRERVHKCHDARSNAAMLVRHFEASTT